MNDSVKTVLMYNGCPIALSDSECRFIYNLLPVGEFYDKRYGRVSITPDKIKQMADNFGKCPAYEVPVKIGHSDGAKSPGKVIGVQAKDNGLEITMLVDPDTAKAINDKQYRYMSAEFDEDYHDKKTGNKVGAVLLGAALVNQPAHPYVAPLVLADDFPDETIDSQLKNDFIPERNYDSYMNELDDLKLQLSDFKAQAAEAAKKLADLEAQNKTLIAERELAENEKNNAEVKAFCDKWTGKGIPPAVVDKVKPLLLAAPSRVLKLSDDSHDDVTSLKFFDELFDAIPKVSMTQISSAEPPAVELSDVDKARVRAKAIADSIR